MSHGSLSVSEVSKSSSLLGKANTSSPQDSESEGFIDILKSAFSSDSSNSETEGGDSKITSDTEGKVSKSSGEDAESSESVKGKATTGEVADSDNVDTQGAETEGSSSKVSAKTGSEETSDSLLKQESSQSESGKEGAADVDKTMSEGNKLLERLDESNKALSENAQAGTEGKGLPPEAAAAAGVAVSQAENASGKTKAVVGNNAVVASEASGGKQAVADSLAGTSEDKVTAVATESSSNTVGQFAAIGAGGAIASQASGEPVSPESGSANKASVDSDPSVDGAVDENAVAMLAAGTLGVVSTAGQADKAVESPTSEQIKWGAPDSATQSASAATKQGAGVDVSQASVGASQVDVAQAGAAVGMAGTAAMMVDGEAKVNGVATTQSVPASTFEGQPLVAAEAEEASVTYGEPMWASTNAELAAAEGGKKIIEASTAAKVATSAALAAQLHNPTAAQLPTDKAAASLVSSGALSQDIAMQSAQAQSLAAANAVSTPIGATEQAKVISAAAASALVLGDGKGQGTKPGLGTEDKSDLAHQLAGVAGQQGLTVAQARGLEAQTVNAAQQPPLQLTRDAAGEQLAERVQMMLSKNLKNIDIRLDPPELGRMQIRMTMNNDVASVQFTVANQQTRDIVEQAMPRLREMLAQQGLQLADTSVQQQNAGQQQQSQYVAGQNGQQGRKNGDNDADGELGLDNPSEVNVDVTSNRDGISFYA